MQKQNENFFHANVRTISFSVFNDPLFHASNHRVITTFFYIDRSKQNVDVRGYTQITYGIRG